MQHSLTKMWIHAIFTTQFKKKWLNQNQSVTIYERIRNHLEELGCYCTAINGTSDHIHILFQLAPSESVSEVMQIIKSETSGWANKNKLFDHRFSWHSGYYAFSVSQSQSLLVSRFIKNQSKQHKKMSFDEEISKLLSLHNLEQPDEDE